MITISENDWTYVKDSLAHLKKLDDVLVDITSLKTSVQNQTASMETLKTENKALRVDINTLTQAVQQQNETIQSMYATVFDLQLQIDEQEQYSRRESIRISGIKEAAGEDLATTIVKLGHDLEVNIATADISTIHRVGKPNFGPHAKPRDILCKFISWKTKDKMMESKKKLKGAAGKEGLYVNEDLTYYRSKLAALARKAESTKYVFSKNGRVLCYLKDKDGPHIALAKPSDLKKLGINVPDLSELGFQSLGKLKHT